MVSRVSLAFLHVLVDSFSMECSLGLYHVIFSPGIRGNFTVSLLPLNSSEEPMPLELWVAHNQYKLVLQIVCILYPQQSYCVCAHVVLLTSVVIGDLY